MTILLRSVARFCLAMTSKFYWVLLAYVITRVAAVFLMVQIEGWRPIEAYWWSEVSSLTIGYGDFAPESDLGRLVVGPFQIFWVFYCAPAIVGHVVTFLFKNAHILTHDEQEWLFKVVGMIFDWQRWQVQAQLKTAQAQGYSLPPLPHCDDQGQPLTCPRQAPDTDYDARTIQP